MPMKELLKNELHLIQWQQKLKITNPKCKILALELMIINQQLLMYRLRKLVVKKEGTGQKIRHQGLDHITTMELHKAADQNTVLVLKCNALQQLTLLAMVHKACVAV